MSDKPIGKRLREARSNKGVSLDEVYAAIKIHPGTLRGLEEDTIDPNIGDVYIKGFLKKYALYLGLKQEELLPPIKTEEPVKTEAPANTAERARGIREYLLPRFEKKIELAPIIAMAKDKLKAYMPTLTRALAIVFALWIILYAGGRLIGGFKERASNRSASKAAIAAVAPVETEAVVAGTFMLQVEALDEVWLRVKADGEIVFVNTLPKGADKLWRAEKEIELWTGRAEALKLRLNGEELGSPGRGTIKNIIIDKNGMRPGKK